MRRIAFLSYGALCYALFLGVFLYAIGFLGNLGVPKSIDSGAAGPWGVAVVVNMALLSVFALQHSVMARPAFKRLWTRIVPVPIERATYVLATNAAMILLFAYWQPIPQEVWRIGGAAGIALTGLYFAGWGLLLYATILIDHFELFGLGQAVRYFTGRGPKRDRFVTPGLYRHIRHPLYVAWFTIFWATPVMTVGHLLFAAVASAYILVAVLFEERDLLNEFGDDYRRWREATPAFLPRPRRNRRPAGGLQPSH
jgi:protein-S-isoprenylcysteine O-methyltransferase Ste14